MSCVLVLGLGDLGSRIAERLTSNRIVDRLIIAGRNPDRGHTYAELLATSDHLDVSFHGLDVLDVASCERLLRFARPDVVVQTACFISPWSFARLETPAAQALRRIGFGVQLPFQIPCVRAVMQAVRGADFQGAVVNCSYPDATHALLSGEGLAPTIGIGNAAMMQACVEQVLRRDGVDDVVRLIAHHAQTVSVMTSTPLAPDVRPWVFVGEHGRPAHELIDRVRAIRWSVATNVLTAAVAVRAIGALLPGGASARLSSPGPMGLPGGYPMRVSTHGVDFDLPPDVTLAAAIAQNQLVGRVEGLAEIRDGIAMWTQKAARALHVLGDGLAEPLESRAALPRARRLARALALTP
ncbi:MAG TPA: hypothetical protein VMU34_11855 [Mycobacterium sp.]|nr:hypothetical protein [Mycobacterium sp.]